MTQPRGLFLVALCGWFGLVSGLVESGLGLLWGWVGYQVNDPDLWVNWHSPWMAPLSLGAWFAGFGVVLGLVAMVAPRTVARFAPFVLIAEGARSALGSIPGLHAWAIAVLVAGLSVRLGGYSRLDSPAFHRFVRRTLPVAGIVWGVLFVATGLVPWTAEWRAFTFGATPSESAPNVLLVVLDTVRADSLSLHGYDRPTTPRLESWAKRGVRFSQARSTTPYTLGTHASLFTGYRMTQTSARVNAPLDGSRLTLAEHLRDRGYATGGFVGNIFYGSARYGLDRGFLHYHDVPGNITRRVTPREFLRSCRLGESVVTWFERKWRILKPLQRQRLDAAELNREALAWVDRTRSSTRPFFLFLNLFDAHSPYSLPAEAPTPFTRVSPERLEADTAKLKGLQARFDRQPSAALSAEIDALRAKVHSDLRNAYDEGIAWIDRKLDELLRDLDRRNLLANTLVIVTADHGEMLGEHDLIGHGDSLHREVVHVPLVVIGGQGMEVPAGAVIDRPVSVGDVPATVADLLRTSGGARAFPGLPLRRFWNERAGDEGDEPVVSEMEHLAWMARSPRMPAASGPMALLTEGTWSYHRQVHETLGVREQMFDLKSDPGEEHDLAGDPSQGDRLGAFRRKFAAMDAPTPTPP